MQKKYTILMALMGLEIGGAETHVVELVKHLSKEGFKIVVASNGGVYVKELDKAGIKHYKVPMNKRSIPNMKKSYHLLEEIIEKENIEIVHAHARIPSFVCAKLKKKMGFTFVTTTHGVFNTGMGLKYLTNWGQKTIAVSDDIKDYLIKNYGMDSGDIFTTINGIDTDKFSPSTKNENILKELGISADDNCLVHVSRIDTGSCLVAEQLVDIALELSKKIEKLKIVIAGGGSEFKRLKEKAESTNKKIGQECVLMIGARTDINEVVAAGKIFVGVSRAALEAMATEKPTIVAGNAGYIGIFGSEKLELAMENNFCCRGCEVSTNELLKRDITYAFNELSNSQKETLGKYGRQVILEYYSVGRMASDCVNAYNAAWEESKHSNKNVLMSGYYGFNNAGDDAILLSIHSNIVKMNRNIDVFVLANNPEQTKIKYGVRVVNRYNILKVINSIRKCDILISGGGSLLQDRTSTRSIIYYLSIIKCAKTMGKKVMLYANGIGPVTKASNRNFVRNVVDKADIITLREDNSLAELKGMGVENKNIFVTADPVFTMNGISRETALKMIAEQGIPMDRPIVGVSVRDWKNAELFLEDFSALCDRVSNELKRTIVFISMQVPNDTNVSHAVQKRMKCKSYILRDDATPFETMGMIGTMDFVMSMRLHTLIFAARQRVPLIGFVYDPKIDYYLKKFDMPSGGSVEEYDFDMSFEIIKNISENRMEYVKKLDIAVKSLEMLAEENETYLMNLLGK
ncbi:MAG: polysaccharide pyruvyl transferase CsaB [Firmicutes bacterium]|nr:polysaccharide pyruvyl transferase CsaB [Bacillota bacterium]